MSLLIASPKIYNAMAEKKSYYKAVSLVALVVFSLYASIIALGYFYYGAHTQIPGKCRQADTTQRSVTCSLPSPPSIVTDALCCFCSDD